MEKLVFLERQHWERGANRLVIGNSEVKGNDLDWKVWLIQLFEKDRGRTESA